MSDIALKDLYANLAHNIHQELILKGHAIIKVNNIEVGIIKNKQPDYYGASIGEMLQTGR